MVSLQFEQLPVPVGDEAMIAVFGEEGELGTGSLRLYEYLVSMLPSVVPEYVAQLASLGSST